ncbi:MAG: hypothetical protein QME68_05225, partial [Elusimicrobiota bacterium]|nr:hypothetical protein [Elusimicrobiota bacterium]
NDPNTDISILQRLSESKNELVRLAATRALHSRAPPSEAVSSQQVASSEQQQTAQQQPTKPTQPTQPTETKIETKDQKRKPFGILSNIFSKILEEWNPFWIFGGIFSFFKIWEWSQLNEVFNADTSKERLQELASSKNKRVAKAAQRVLDLRQAGVSNKDAAKVSRLLDKAENGNLIQRAIATLQLKAFINDKNTSTKVLEVISESSNKMVSVEASKALYYHKDATLEDKKQAVEVLNKWAEKEWWKGSATKALLDIINDPNTDISILQRLSESKNELVRLAATRALHSRAPPSEAVSSQQVASSEQQQTAQQQPTKPTQPTQPTETKIETKDQKRKPFGILSNIFSKILEEWNPFWIFGGIFSFFKIWEWSQLNEVFNADTSKERLQELASSKNKRVAKAAQRVLDLRQAGVSNKDAAKVSRLLDKAENGNLIQRAIATLQLKAFINDKNTSTKVLEVISESSNKMVSVEASKALYYHKDATLEDKKQAVEVLNKWAEKEWWKGSATKALLDIINDPNTDISILQRLSESKNELVRLAATRALHSRAPPSEAVSSQQVASSEQQQTAQQQPTKPTQPTQPTETKIETKDQKRKPFGILSNIFSKILEEWNPFWIFGGIFSFFKIWEWSQLNEVFNADTSKERLQELASSKNKRVAKAAQRVLDLRQAGVSNKDAAKVSRLLDKAENGNLIQRAIATLQLKAFINDKNTSTKVLEVISESSNKMVSVEASKALYYHKDATLEDKKQAVEVLNKWAEKEWWKGSATKALLDIINDPNTDISILQRLSESKNELVRLAATRALHSRAPPSEAVSSQQVASSEQQQTAQQQPTKPTQPTQPTETKIETKDQKRKPFGILSNIFSKILEEWNPFWIFGGIFSFFKIWEWSQLNEVFNADTSKERLQELASSKNKRVAKAAQRVLDLRQAGVSNKDAAKVSRLLDKAENGNLIQRAIATLQLKAFINDKNTSTKVLEVISESSNKMVSVEASKALYYHKDATLEDKKQAVEVLNKWAEKEWWKGSATKALLDIINDPNTDISILQRLSESKNGWVRLAATRALHSRAPPSELNEVFNADTSKERLQKLANSKNERVAKLAQRVLDLMQAGVSNKDAAKVSTLESKEGNIVKVVKDTQGQVHIVSLENPVSIADKKDVILSLAGNVINLSNSHKELLLMLSVLEELPIEQQPKFYTYSTLIEDLFGFTDTKNNIIALHNSVINNPIALFYETAEYLTKLGILKLELVNNNTLRMTINGKSEDIILTKDAVEIANRDPNNPHYLLRALQRELFGETDVQLTQKDIGDKIVSVILVGLNRLTKSILDIVNMTRSAIEQKKFDRKVQSKK